MPSHLKFFLCLAILWLCRFLLSFHVLLRQMDLAASVIWSVGAGREGGCVMDFDIPTNSIVCFTLRDSGVGEAAACSHALRVAIGAAPM